MYTYIYIYKYIYIYVVITGPRHIDYSSQTLPKQDGHTIYVIT